MPLAPSKAAPLIRRRSLEPPRGLRAPWAILQERCAPHRAFSSLSSRGEEAQSATTPCSRRTSAGASGVGAAIWSRTRGPASGARICVRRCRRPTSASRSSPRGMRWGCSMYGLPAVSALALAPAPLLHLLGDDGGVALRTDAVAEGGLRALADVGLDLLPVIPIVMVPGPMNPTRSLMGLLSSCELPPRAGASSSRGSGEATRPDARAERRPRPGPRESPGVGCPRAEWGL